MGRNKGYHHSEETKKKISEALKGRIFTMEHKRKIGEANKGKKYPHSEITKLKMSQAHIGKRLSEEWKKKISKALEGKKSYLWKGGRIRRKGYILCLKKEHPFSWKQGYIFEHRLVMEAELGRYLLPREVIHHIDGDRSNNEIDNLMLFGSWKEHRKYHCYAN
jgi:hypothetical protein